MGVKIVDTYKEDSGDTLRLEFYISIHSGLQTKVVSEEYAITSDRGGSVIFQMQVLDKNSELELSVKLTKKEPNDELIYTIDYNQRYVNNEIYRNFVIDDSSWRVIDSPIKPVTISLHNSAYSSNYLIINISLKVRCTMVPYSQYIAPKTNSQLASLHEDTESTDFELRGKDGSVHLHKVIAGAASPVLRRMFSGAWRETAEGVVEVPGTTKATLEHFKNYIYLDTIPEEGVEQLLMLALFYMMPELEQRCVNKLKNSVTAETASDLISLAVNNHSQRLLFAILERVKKSLNVDDIRAHHATS